MGRELRGSDRVVSGVGAVAAQEQAGCRESYEQQGSEQGLGHRFRRIIAARGQSITVSYGRSYQVNGTPERG
jgi:hypothetical protein